MNAQNDKNSKSPESDQKVGETPSDSKKAQAKAQEGKTFQGKGTEKRGGAK